jgi:hypothetical protein
VPPVCVFGSKYGAPVLAMVMRTLVPFVEDDAHPADVPGELRDLTRHEQLLMIEAFVITRTQRVIDQQDGAAIGIHIRHAQDEVGVLRGR